MSKPSEKNLSAALEKAKAVKRDTTTQKVTEALKTLKKRTKKLTISAVAKEAKVSNKTIYNRPDLKAMIEESIAVHSNQAKSTNQEKITKGSLTQTARIEKMRNQIKELSEEKMKLLDQNVELTEMALQQKRKIAELEERLYSQKRVIEIKK